MKSNGLKIKKFLFLLLIIVISLISIKSKNSLMKKSNNKKFKISEILFKLKQSLSSSQKNHFLFLIGVFSEFYPELKDLYQTLKPYSEQFISCFSNFQESPKSIPNFPQFSSIEKFFKNFNTKNKRKKFCNFYTQKIKENAFKYFEEINQVSNYKIIPGIPLNDNKSYCNNIKKWSKEEKVFKINREISEDLRIFNIKSFWDICDFFADKNCEKFDIGLKNTKITEDLQELAKDSFRYLNPINEAGKCIGLMLNDKNQLKIKEIKSKIIKYFKVTGKDLISLGIDQKVDNIKNLGKFGAFKGIKAGFLIMKLSDKVLKLKDFNNDEDISFRIGEIVGNSILIVKGLLNGNRY